MLNMNMSNVLDDLTKTLTFKTGVQSVVNYKPVITYTETTKEGVIYPSKSDELKSLVIDSSLAYFTVYSVDSLDINDLLSYKGKIFKIINKQDFSDYGYEVYIFEEVKNA